ncbi:hypothetical protein TNCV_4664631 [Trichonephila clavipes]|uniref:Uncharacterized protein n=1 Tax=Trichonephila clavipes TaxID=2585209 RepID=A0A8X6RU12_TRICX|nr:hypothetical protein TNCV_4664631 [Trichonephila clavipes]
MYSIIEEKFRFVCDFNSSQAEYLGFDEKYNLYTGYFIQQFQPLHKRNFHAEFKPLHRLNEVSKKWRSVSFTDAFVHCPDFGSNRNFIDRGIAPIICGRHQGVQDVCLSSILF